MGKRNQSAAKSYPQPTDKIRQIPDTWWMTSCHRKHDSSLKSCRSSFWQEPQSSDANGLLSPWVSQHWLECWQAWEQRLTRWRLRSVRLLVARTHSRRLAVDTHEQDVLKLTLEPSLAKPKVKGPGTPWGWICHHGWGHGQLQASPRKGHWKFPGDKQVQSKEGLHLWNFLSKVRAQG